eukprot:gnl/Trimastix_PCT/2467.p2 GENE.gnl/Trimastix_PCT/2467~~gnl/Trimastix_PCT/2467.p2  ORF type:complete len:464 (-),score=100.27 gnl/Trimastix_PCT/2467:197-1588(-)
MPLRLRALHPGCWGWAAPRRRSTTRSKTPRSRTRSSACSDRPHPLRRAPSPHRSPRQRRSCRALSRPPRHVSRRCLLGAASSHSATSASRPSSKLSDPPPPRSPPHARPLPPRPSPPPSSRPHQPSPRLGGRCRCRCDTRCRCCPMPHMLHPLRTGRPASSRTSSPGPMGRWFRSSRSRSLCVPRARRSPLHRICIHRRRSRGRRCFARFPLPPPRTRTRTTATRRRRRRPQLLARRPPLALAPAPAPGGGPPQPYILKHIILFFTKAYAYDALVAFFEGCAQVEIDEYLEYEKALSALREAYKHLLKSRADDRDEKVANLQTRITLVEKFVKVRKLIKTQPKESIRLCHELLQDENADAALRVGDVYALLVQYFHERGRVQEAYQALEQMRQRGIALDPYLEERYIVDIYAAVGLNAAEVGAIGGEEGEDAGDTGSLDDDGLADGDVADEEEGEALDDILDD